MFELPEGPLKSALSDLDQWMHQECKTLEIVLIGAVAVSTYTHDHRFTQDMDTVKPIHDDDIVRQVAILSQKYGLPSDWLSDSASTLTLPDGFFLRTNKLAFGKAIQLSICARVDLICLKAAAYVSRGSDTVKDLEDLLELKPLRQEMDRALEFVVRYFSPPIKKDPWKSQFEEALGVLHALCK